MSSSQTSTEILTREKTRLADGWKVVVLNDPVNLMTYVVLVFRKVFGYNEVKARQHMLEVHEKGQSILWVGTREVAESYVHHLHRWQLNAHLERYEED